MYPGHGSVSVIQHYYKKRGAASEKSLKAHRPAHLEYTAENNKEGNLSQTGRTQQPRLSSDLHQHAMGYLHSPTETCTHIHTHKQTELGLDIHTYNPSWALGR